MHHFVTEMCTLWDLCNRSCDSHKLCEMGPSHTCFFIVVCLLFHMAMSLWWLSQTTLKFEEFVCINRVVSRMLIQMSLKFVSKLTKNKFFSYILAWHWICIKTIIWSNRCIRWPNLRTRGHHQGNISLRVYELTIQISGASEAVLKNIGNYVT